MWNQKVEKYSKSKIPKNSAQKFPRQNSIPHHFFSYVAEKSGGDVSRLVGPGANGRAAPRHVLIRDR